MNPVSNSFSLDKKSNWKTNDFSPPFYYFQQQLELANGPWAKQREQIEICSKDRQIRKSRQASKGIEELAKNIKWASSQSRR